MFYVFLSICCSVLVSIMLKLAKRYHIDVYQAITWNYSIAIVLTWLFLKPDLRHLNNAPFALLGLLGLLLPLLFVIIATSVKVTGIVRTDAAQRLSLFIPFAAAFLIFNETSTAAKLVGLAIGLIAVVCLIPWNKQAKDRKTGASSWVYLLIVFLGMGIIDILLKRVSQISIGTSLFIVYSLAFIFALIGLLYQVFTKTMRFSWPHIFIGWVLGIANFGNILFYLKAHQSLSKNPSIVFASMNIGVIVFGTLIGVFIFKEKLSLFNKIGLVLAILAIAVIYYPQFFTNLFAH
ncbi:DMT family transporter [Mucilaginibacter sp. BJC16-A38]|uniref:DMT family transporter n=1 Tax=Mucilaginibacter phenanthrenivorans TaxID=1234842 RepID=UPI002157C54F|nr:DMT family transporter [Mucilaginibacter phenanthrenivorans]MCR8560576.1 DMT family transporter [Mucilaginibacter phenanthrenivorans]